MQARKIRFGRFYNCFTNCGRLNPNGTRNIGTVMPTSAILSDDELLCRVRDGQLEYYEILIRRYNPRLFRLVYPIVRDKSEAEDVIQETHLRALTHLHQFAGRSKFATWLGRIGIYEALGRLRSRRRFDSTEETGESSWKTKKSPGAADPEQQAIGAEMRAVLQASVRGLPQAYRSVVVARLIYDLSTLETCERLKLSEETVKTRLHRAKAMLRRELVCHRFSAAG
jgi:RNA polymerase sigma-70 factor, ECF subfamily